ncbi:hypothetical protein PG994_001713 [Apiospora phragmitis]|uniref:Uncharacterized protein n=1 Tax=Apiospora phragmitis TaxID=2905665 RepID=A0ABR1WU84_9PEZI
MFQYAGFDNSTGIIEDGFTSLKHTIESTLALIMVDDMSRIGLGANNGNLYHVFPDHYQFLRTMPQRNTDPEPYFDRILNGQTIVLPPLGVEADKLMPMHWDVHISGLAYNAKSTTTYLALTVLFTCSAIAVCHTIFVLATQKSSEAWDCIEELVVLCQLSRPSPSALVNTSSGIHRRAAYRVGAHIVAQKPSHDGEEAPTAARPGGPGGPGGT